MKVEDRLLKIGKLWQEKKTSQLMSYIEEAQKSAYPVIKSQSSETNYTN